MTTTQYKYVPFNVKFIHNNQEYTKTNHDRGYYFANGIKIFRRFGKKVLVQVDKQYTDLAY